MAKVNRSADPPSDWLEALHEAVAAGTDSQFDHPQSDNLPAGHFEAVRDCLRLLEQARRSCKSIDGRHSDDIRDDVATIPMPKRIGRFQIVRELGRGGFGVVFLAFDPRVGRNVALKVPRPEILMGASTRPRFLREAKAAGALEHPNLIPIFEVGEEGPLCYIASAYCAGPNLARWLADHVGRVPNRKTAEIVSALARGVEHAHSRGVLHRDIKPANVLLDSALEPSSGTELSSLVPRLTDFGLAKVLALSEEETRTGSLLGTPAYMAPEQAESRLDDIGPTTDVYALGVILYELVTGQPPFRGPSDVQTLQRVARGEPPRPSHFRQSLPKDLEAIVLKCLEREGSRRYPTAGMLADDLDRFLAGEPTLARPASSVKRAVKWARRRPAIAGLLSVVCVTILLLTGGGWWYSGQLRVALDESRAHELKAKRLLYVANVSLAERFVAINNVQQARELLARDVPRGDEPDLRGFAWHHLRRRLNEEELTLRGHTADVYCVRFAPNGRLLATASQDQTARVWDSTSGKCLSVLSGHAGEVNCVAFSTDSKCLASASDDGTVRIWDLATREVLQTLAAHERGVYGVAFSPDGAKLATCGRDKRVRLWATSNWQQIALLEGHTDDVGAVVFSRQGDILVTGGDDRTVRVWDVASGQLKITKGGFRSAVSSIAISRDGQRVLSAGRQDHEVLIWKTASTAAIKVHQRFSEWIHAVMFLDQDTQIVVAAKDGEVRIIDAKTSEIVRKLSGHAERVWSVALSPDERHLATASADRTIKIWNLIAGKSHQKFASADSGFVKLALSGDGKLLVAGSGNGQIAVLEANSRQVQWQKGAAETDPGATITSLAISRHGELLAVSHLGESRAQLWDTGSGERAAVLQTGNRAITALAFAPNGLALAVGNCDGEISFWDPVTYEARSRISLAGFRLPRLAYSPNGKLLAISGDSGAIMIWDVAGQKELLTLREEAPYDILSLSFSPDGKLIGAAGSSRVINLWNVASGEKVTALAGHSDTVQALSFSPDGGTLASGGDDGNVKLWDLTTKQEIFSLRDRFDWVHAVVFHPDGHQLIAACHASEGESLHFWSTEPPAAPVVDKPARIGPEIRVNQTEDVSHTYPSGMLATSGQGSFVAAWHTTDDRGRIVRGRCFDAQGVAKHDEFVGAHEHNNVPAVAMNAHGQFVATWSVRDGNSHNTIVAQRYDAAGNLQGPEILVTDHKPDGPYRSDGMSSVGMNDDGGFVISWDTAYDGRYHVHLRRYDPEGSPLGDETKANTESIGDHHYSRLAMNPEGAFVMVWIARSSQKEPYVIQASRYNADGQPLDEHEFQVSPLGMTGQQMFPSVAIQSDGGFIASWTNLDVFSPGCSDIYLQRFDAHGKPIGATTKVNSLLPHRRARHSSVAVTSEGYFIVCWTSEGYDSDGSSGVFARRFNAAGAPLGAEFRVPGNLEGDQFGVCVAATTPNEFAISWCDNAVDHKGVFVQRFRASVPDSLSGKSR